MPPIIAEKHAQFIIDNFEAEKQKVMNNVLIFPLHKFGYIIPCSFLLRIVPNLKRGVQLIGFLVKVTDFSEYYHNLEKNMDPDDLMILLTDDNWKLQCFNIRASHIFGIIPSRANLKKYHSTEDKIYVPKFIPELDDPEFIKQAQFPSVSNTFINLKAINKAMESEIEIIAYNLEQESINSINALNPSHDNT